MTIVLGIDAAWTATKPSGVVLVGTMGSKWRCLAVSPSYESFMRLAAGRQLDWQGPFTGQPPDTAGLLSAATSLASAPIDLITVDIPIATVPITGRREADQRTSREFAQRKCPTHSPSCDRPGPLGATLSISLAASGFPIATATTPGGTPQHLVEVYPHPALLSLLRRDERVRYKVSKAAEWWPQRDQRIASLLAVFTAIHNALTDIFGPLGVPLPQLADVRTCSQLKKYEDALDALVCAWVGVKYLKGEAIGLGDENAAIWCPSDVTRHRY